MRLTFFILAAAALAACGPPDNLAGGAPGAVPAGGTVCNAAIYNDLVGEPIATVYTLNTGLNVRVLGADEFVTKDFDPNRLTFTTTRDDGSESYTITPLAE